MISLNHHANKGHSSNSKLNYYHQLTKIFKPWSLRWKKSKPLNKIINPLTNLIKWLVLRIIVKKWLTNFVLFLDTKHIRCPPSFLCSKTFLNDNSNHNIKQNVVKPKQILMHRKKYLMNNKHRLLIKM